MAAQKTHATAWAYLRNGLAAPTSLRARKPRRPGTCRPHSSLSTQRGNMMIAQRRPRGAHVRCRVPIVALALVLAISARASAQPEAVSAFHTRIPLRSDPAADLANTQPHATPQSSPSKGVWRDLFAPLPSDFRALFSWPNALILGVGG